MSYELDKVSHSLYSLHYNFIQVIKYRKKVFVNNAIMDLLKTKIREIAETFFSFIYHAPDYLEELNEQ